VIWIETSVVFAIHDRQIAEHGGSDGLRDRNGLEAALARPQQLLAYGEPPPDLAALAAAYAFGLAKNHAFVDGNKRTSAMVTVTFLELNGRHFVASEADVVTMWTDLAAGVVTEADFAAWLRTKIQ
jgi:death-on-curing protein